MKKLFLGTLLPIFAFASLIGSGYATWYFADQLSSNDNTEGIDIKITEYAQVGTISITQGKSGNSLTLDQSSESGITFNEEVIATYTKPTSSDGILNSDEGLKVTVTVDLGATLKDYVQLNKGFEDKEKDGSYTLDITTEMTKSDGNGTFTLDGSYFAYVNEPTTLDAYKTMYNACKDLTFTISFNAQVINS